ERDQPIAVRLDHALETLLQIDKEGVVHGLDREPKEPARCCLAGKRSARGRGRLRVAPTAGQEGRYPQSRQTEAWSNQRFHGRNRRWKPELDSRVSARSQVAIMGDC